MATAAVISHAACLRVPRAGVHLQKSIEGSIDYEVVLPGMDRRNIVLVGMGADSAHGDDRAAFSQDDTHWSGLTLSQRSVSN